MTAIQIQIVPILNLRRCDDDGSAQSQESLSKHQCLFTNNTSCIVLHHWLADPHNVHKHAMQQFEMNHLGGHAKVDEQKKKRSKIAICCLGFGGETSAASAS
eukprot:scaffold28772_cov69-Skeletonema_marinoi.AAC.2